MIIVKGKSKFNRFHELPFPPLIPSTKASILIISIEASFLATVSLEVLGLHFGIQSCIGTLKIQKGAESWSLMDI